MKQNVSRAWAPAIVCAVFSLLHCATDGSGNAGGSSSSGGTSGGGSGSTSGSTSSGASSGGTSGSSSGSTSGSSSGSTSGSTSGSSSSGSTSGGSSGSTSSGSSGSSSGGASGSSSGSSSGGSSGSSSGLGGNGCAGGACLNPSCQPLGTPQDPGASPNTGFDLKPTFIPNDVIIPTFDDGPDSPNSPPDPAYGVGAWTNADLQWLSMNNIHADFFVVLDDWCGDIRGPGGDPTCQAALTEILTHQNVGDHTVHHLHMGTPNSAPAGSVPNGCGDAASCEAELTGVESYVDMVSGGGRPHLTRFRAPYGEPFQAMSASLSFVAPVVAKFAVHVGWNLDANDWSYNGTSCAVTPCPTAQDIANNVLNQVGTGPGKGQWGILLMHATYPWTHDALPLLFGTNGALTTRGFRLGTVEDAICWKYGKHSWDIIPNRGSPN